MIPKALLVVITVLLLATPASAATIVWDFATLATAGEHPTPFPFTSGGFTLIATGSSPNHPTPPFLAPSGPLAQPATPIFVKNGGGDENGLGVCLSTGNCGPSNEIDASESPRDILRIDRDALPLTNWTFQMGSTTNGETWHVWVSNSEACAVPLCITVATGTDEGVHSLPDAGRYIFFGTDLPLNTGDTLLAVITAQSVPEPSSLILFGIGLTGLGAMLRRQMVPRPRQIVRRSRISRRRTHVAHAASRMASSGTPV